MIEIECLTPVDYAIFLVGTLFLIFSSGKFVRSVASYIRGDADYDSVDDVVGRANNVIGVCENILIVVFIFSSSYTALAVIFAAEGIVSLQSETDDYYQFRFLAGTLVNFTYSVIISLIMIQLVKII